jgi:glycosyltransferase involved in cell wall biosynthesis
MAVERPAPIHVSYLQRAAGVGYSIERLFDNVRSRLPDTIDPHVHLAPHAGTRPSRILRNCLWARKHQGQVNHITGDAYYLALGLRSRRTVLTIHDCVSLRRLTGWRKWVIHWLWYRLPTWRAGVITVISEEAKRELLSYVHIPEERIRTIPNCVGDEFQPAPRPEWPERPLLLHIGSTPNKNLTRVSQAIRALPVRLRIVGNPEDCELRLLEECGIDYSLASNITDQQMVEEYRSCDAVVLASTYEGFGLPIVEAQAIGRPILTSDLPPMSDIAGDTACLVNPYNVESIRCGVVRLLQNSAYREALVERGFLNVKKYRAENVAGQYASLYEELCRSTCQGSRMP